jgi:splicing factor 45
MSKPNQGSKTGGGLSLYANLLDPSSESSAPGTISSAPVVYKQPESNGREQQTDEAAKKVNAGR